MTATADPRTNPEFKRLRQDERVIAMLGAILDALTKQKSESPAVQPSVPAKRPRSEK